MEKSLAVRKINLFLCNKYNCWLRPESCIKRQEVNKDMGKEEKNKLYFMGKELEYFPDCVDCNQGQGIVELMKTYFRFAEVKHGKRQEEKEG